MPVVCPAILAPDEEIYRTQVERIANFAHRIQIDLSDGIFAPHKTIKPEEAWWPVGFKADFHLMFKRPLQAIQIILKHRPNLIIIHAEAEGDFTEVVNLCHKNSVKVGVALLPKTSPAAIFSALSDIDHVLIFSGDLGKYGGHANLGLLPKARMLKQQKTDLEVGWDGGINEQNISEIVFGGVDVLNVGGSVVNADDPERTYAKLVRIAEETGTT